MRQRARILASLCSLTLLVLGAGRWASRHFIFPSPGRASAGTPHGLQRHVTVARDGVDVSLLLTPALEGRPTVVYFHNNRETVESVTDVSRMLATRGLGTLLVEYRGYGESAAYGAPSEPGLYADAEAGLDWLDQRGVKAHQIVLWGTSLGTGVAAEMARRGRGARLVLTTPYTSIPDLITDVVPFAPATVLVGDHFDTFAKAAEIVVPTLVIHGDEDEIVPYWMGERVKGAIRGARLLRVSGGKHGDLFARDPQRLWTAVFEHAG